MTAPAQRQIGVGLETVFGIGEGVTAHPRCAILRGHVAVLIEHRLALIAQRGLEILVGEQLGDIGCGLHNFDLPPHIFHFDIGNRIQQVLHILDVIGGDHVTGAHLPLGVTLNRQQFVGIRLGNVLSV